MTLDIRPIHETPTQGQARRNEVSGGLRYRGLGQVAHKPHLQPAISFADRSELALIQIRQEVPPRLKREAHVALVSRSYRNSKERNGDSFW